MAHIHVCFGVVTKPTELCGESDAEQMYQTVFKKLVSFLYQHPKFAFSWTLNGVQIEAYEKSHPEFITILSELSSRKQIEILGGGYYDPLLPLLLPIDRVGQIEFLTTFQRKSFGKRPRGIGMSYDVWDPLIIGSLKSCGFDFVQLSSEMLPARCPPFSPLILEYAGQTLSVLPVHRELFPRADISPDEYIRQTMQTIEASAVAQMVGKNDAAQKKFVAVCTLSPADLLPLIEASWFDGFALALQNQTQLALTTPSLFLKETTDFYPAYIPPCTVPAKTAIQDRIQTNPHILSLYSRMMQMSVLINQSRGDKARKKAAREKLWEAQNRGAFFAAPHDAEKQHTINRLSYKNLLQAEQLIRAASGFANSALCFDFDADGYNEYLYLFDSYNAFITKKGASIFELDVFKSAHNYVDLFPFAPDSAYPAHIFTDHLIAPESFAAFSAGQPVETIFPSAIFSEISLDRIKKDLRLHCAATYGEKNQPITLRKKFIATDSSIQVQYILANNSDEPLQAVFATESAFSLPVKSFDEYRAEIVTGQQSKELQSSKPFAKNKDISFVQLTDVPNNVSFVFEPNETAGFLFRPSVLPVAPNLPPTVFFVKEILYWNIDLPPGREIEKTVNLTIITPRKKQKKNK